MWEQIMETAIKSGLWAVLFVALLTYVLQDGRKREEKYQKTIETLTERLEIVVEIKEKVDKITKKRTKQKEKIEEGESL